MTTSYVTPQWWNQGLHGRAWARVRDAMRADWEDRTPPAGTERTTIGRIAIPRVEPTPQVPDVTAAERDDPRGSARVTHGGPIRDRALPGMMKTHAEPGAAKDAEVMRAVERPRSLGWDDLEQSHIVDPHIRGRMP